MLPPVDERTIRDNPGFAKLYRILKGEVLNPDGSARCGALAGRDAVQQNLHRARVNHAKAHLLERAIRTVSAAEVPETATASVPARRAEPPEESSLAHLLAVLPPLISSEQHIDADDAAAALCSPPLSDLERHLPRLAALLSADLHASALDVARIAHPSTNPSYLHRRIPSLPADFAALAGTLSETRSALADSRVEALVSLTSLLRSRTQTLTLLVRTLESKHGLASRKLELQALEVSQNSQLVEVDVKTALNNARRDLYSPQTISALANYSSHLKDAQIRAAERLRGLQAELAEYGVGVDSAREKEMNMREMARMYNEMESQMEDVKKDLARLGNKL